MKKYLFFLLLSNPVIAMDLESSLKNLRTQLITLENQLRTLRGVPVTPPEVPPRDDYPSEPSPQPGPQTPPITQQPGPAREAPSPTPQREKKTTGFRTSQKIEYRPTIIPPAVATPKIQFIGLLNEVNSVEQMKSTTPEELAEKQAHALALLKGIDQLVARNLDEAQKGKNKKEIFDQINRLVAIEPLSIYLAYQILKKIKMPPYRFIHETYKNLVTQVENNWQKLLVHVPFGTRVDMDQGLGFADKLEPLLQQPDVPQKFKNDINELRGRLLNLLVDVTPEQREKYEEMGFYVDQYVSMLNPLEQSFCRARLAMNQSKIIFNPFAVDLAIMQKLFDRYHNAMRSIRGFILEDIIKKINGVYSYMVAGKFCSACTQYQSEILRTMKDLLEQEKVSKATIIEELKEQIRQKSETELRQLKKPVIDESGYVKMEEGQYGMQQQKEQFIEESDVVNYETILTNLTDFLSDINTRLERSDITEIIETKIPKIKEIIEKGCL